MYVPYYVRDALGIQRDVARVSEADERKTALQISCCFALSTCSRALSAAQGIGIIGCMD